MLYMAKPGLGKSMFMTNLIFSYILQNKKVLLITNEMS
jgi:replicative DNA helicase